MKTSPWTKYLIMLAVVFGVDYMIASFFAGNSKDDVWLYFTLLLVIPLFFAIKTTIVRVLLWLALERGEAVANLVSEFSRNSWPKPQWNYDVATDYLHDVMYNTEVSDEVRVLAAQMYGEHNALFATQQIVSAFMANNTLKNAINQYQRVAKEPDDL